MCGINVYIIFIISSLPNCRQMLTVCSRDSASAVCWPSEQKTHKAKYSGKLRSPSNPAIVSGPQIDFSNKPTLASGHTVKTCCSHNRYNARKNWLDSQDPLFNYRDWTLVIPLHACFMITSMLLNNRTKLASLDFIVNI